MLIHMKTGERKLDFYALQSSLTARLNPAMNLAHHDFMGSATDLLDDKARPDLPGVPTLLCAPPVYVEPKDTPFIYKATTEEDDDFTEHDEESGCGEYDFRHPGTHWESDDEDERGWNEIFSPITTKAGQYLGSILLAGAAGTPSCELKPAYKLQLSVRVDEKRLALVYDCFEYKGRALALEDPLPSTRSIMRYENVVLDAEPRGGGFFDSDEEDSEDSDDERLDEPVQVHESRSSEDDRSSLRVQGHAGDFMASRVLRLRVPLATVRGARIHSPPITVDGITDSEARALLVLELHTPPAKEAFAARKVGSRHLGECEFATVPDWTPNQAASVATRHYISGIAAEIKGLAAHLGSLDPRIAEMLREPPSHDAASSRSTTTNSLAPPASLALAAAPPFYNYSTGATERADQEGGVPSLQSLAAAAAGSQQGAGKLTCERVHQLMVERLGITRKHAEAANPCFKRGVLLRHIELDEGTTLDDIICEGECIVCGEEVSATIGDVLDQPACGGCDYEEGGLEGAAQCEDCCGMYVTGLCGGDARLDSGKFHNHCTECPDFGQCIGDYRERHCEDCGKHFFAGLSGFACTHCGGGRGFGSKSRPLSEMPPPPPSAFDGVMEGERDKVRELLQKVSPVERFLFQDLLGGASGEDSELTNFQALMLSVFGGIEAEAASDSDDY